jgi:hypothetical protein
VKASRQVTGSKPRRSKTAEAKGRRRTTFLGKRPRILTLTLRGQVVDVELVPVVGTTTHVNFEITFRRGRRILNWVPTRAELESIARAAAMHTEQETSH